MKAASTIAVLATVMALAGCAQQGVSMKLPPGAKDGLTLTLAISQATPRIGDRVKAIVTAGNSSKKPIVISADTTAVVLLDLWRPAGPSWDRALRLPEAARTKRITWRLQPGEVKTFELLVDVTPDWPTAETLRLTGQLNGRPDLRAEVVLRVQPRQQEPQ